MSTNAYLGVAMKYPLQLVNGSAALVSDKDLIDQSIAVYLSTERGTKYFLPECGSRVREAMFEPNDVVLEDWLRMFIADTIKNWEKRVKFVSVEFEHTGSVVNCTITYRILSSNEIDSFIFPFYKELKY